MANRIPWFERTFQFDGPADLFPELIGRLAGTPARVEEIARQAGGRPEILTRREGETWSIQENIGHLHDLEGLTMSRLDDYDAGLETLRPADLTNRATHAANHNAREIGGILEEFRRARGATIARLDAMAPEKFARVAKHPRLGTPMRLVDLIEFWCEHDDYHIARMRELLRMFA